ncbi:hypothetical protein JET14_12985 [Martelella lutilitoris]|uniref:DUF6456 domain-containing protein n=1 Tax=Martelella lutilitoris TaxID=2583532 RepID=A0A7T7HHE3_9HYPH|nr:DUF6456 domain-containing protein [Martelella lutilitoris]QQM29243.1 hypothetical protein JET14_12985 [Martelella lutilitoris]
MHERRAAAMTDARTGEKTPLEMLARLKGRDGGRFLPQVAHDAGERLFSDFNRAQMQPRITASLQPRLESRARAMRADAAGLSDSALDARRRVGRALLSVGPELADVLLDFVCFEKGLEQMERERQWPVRSAKLMVRTALLALARHYAPPPPRRAIRHWGGEGYRPEIAAMFAEE